MREKVFIDTSAWISLVAARDPHHRAMADEWLMLLNGGIIPVTTSDVISETITYLRRYASHAVAVQFYTFIKEAESEQRLAIAWVNEPLFAEAWEIFTKYADQKFSAVDCTSFALCMRERIKRALTLDHHFAIVGIRPIPETLAGA
ncbi:MAG TPA: PIN domain-containing protein [Firmicutes bacterium]|nr:PIN domain-containing protein [Bacillota bacterium]HHY97467.1 PIN domain-containing protein [Bacillota bacterium]